MKITTKGLTYLGVPADLRTYLPKPGSKDTGRRVTALLWRDKAVGQDVEHEAGTLVLHYCTGDGRYVVDHPKALRVFAEKVIPNGTFDQADEFAAEHLKDFS